MNEEESHLKQTIKIRTWTCYSFCLSPAVTPTSTRWHRCSSCTSASCRCLWCRGLSTTTSWAAPSRWTLRFVWRHNVAHWSHFRPQNEPLSLLPLLFLHTQGWKKLEQQVALLPRINYNLLSYICRWVGSGWAGKEEVGLAGSWSQVAFTGSSSQLPVWGAAPRGRQQDERGELGHCHGHQPAQASDRRPLYHDEGWVESTHAHASRVITGGSRSHDICNIVVT